METKRGLPQICDKFRFLTIKMQVETARAQNLPSSYALIDVEVK
jgi:hypothetical protein